jgi:excisionase family DNA binding protein
MGDDILNALDARMKQIAEETFRRMSVSSNVGAVKVKNAAVMLDLSEFRVRQLIREGKLKVVRPTPKRILVPQSEIRRYLEEES